MTVAVVVGGSCGPLTLWLVTRGFFAARPPGAYEAVSVALAYGQARCKKPLRGEGWVGRHAQKFGELVQASSTRPRWFASPWRSRRRGLLAGLSSEQLNVVVANVFLAPYRHHPDRCRW